MNMQLEPIFYSALANARSIVNLHYLPLNFAQKRINSNKCLAEEIRKGRTHFKSLKIRLEIGPTIISF